MGEIKMIKVLNNNEKLSDLRYSQESLQREIINLCKSNVVDSETFRSLSAQRSEIQHNINSLIMESTPNIIA